MHDDHFSIIRNVSHSSEMCVFTGYKIAQEIKIGAGNCWKLLSVSLILRHFKPSNS